jgi:hypothetical protein
MNFLPERLDLIAAQLAENWGATSFPRELADQLPFYWSLNIQRLPRLTIAAIGRWFGERGLPNPMANTPDRSLFGCLLAHKGHGLIFLDSAADDAEQRFTLAHEFSHYLLDHELPRSEALAALGEDVRPILDGERRPTAEERLEALRQWVDVQPFHHLMQREAGGQFMDLRTSRAELDADLLALELLAPHRLVIERCGIDRYDAMIERLLPLLTATFGLPSAIAQSYAAQLAGHFGKQDSLRERFSG